MGEICPASCLGEHSPLGVQSLGVHRTSYSTPLKWGCTVGKSGERRRAQDPTTTKETTIGDSQDLGLPRTATAVLGGIIQERRSGEPPVKRSLLALAWKTSSLPTFTLGLRKLGRRHTAVPEEPKWKILKD